MVDLITNDLTQDILEIRRCPRCEMTTTFIHIVSWDKDEHGDIKELDFHRCLQCLTLFTVELKEVENGIKSSDIQ